MTFLLSPIGRLIAGIAVIAVLISAAYFIGKMEQKLLDERTRAEKSAIVERERGAIDEKARSSSDAALCVSLGGMLNDDGKCL